MARPGHVVPQMAYILRRGSGRGPPRPKGWMGPVRRDGEERGAHPAETCLGGILTSVGRFGRRAEWRRTGAPDPPRG